MDHLVRNICIQPHLIIYVNNIL